MIFRLTKEAQAVMNLVKEGVHPNDMEGAEAEFAQSWSKGDGFWYALQNGYIEPEKIISDKEDLDRIREAMKVLESFEELWQKISLEF